MKILILINLFWKLWIIILLLFTKYKSKWMISFRFIMIYKRLNKSNSRHFVGNQKAVIPSLKSSRISLFLYIFSFENLKRYIYQIHQVKYEIFFSFISTYCFIFLLYSNAMQLWYKIYISVKIKCCLMITQSYYLP